MSDGTTEGLRETAEAREKPAVDETVKDRISKEDRGQETEEVILKVGYTVGYTDDDRFVFKVLGTTPTVLELIGLQEFAANNIQRLYEKNHGGGDVLTMEVGKLVVQLNEKVNDLLERVGPKRPTNLV
jgi:hypothetical protein